MFYGRKYMFDNWSLIPGEAFTATASVVNNIIDKISNAVGYIITTKGNKEDWNKALEYITKSIEEDPNMPDLTKAALIANQRKILKEYRNKTDIFETAINNLDQNASADHLDTDWINEFFEKAGMINDEQIKLLFGKLLAEACNGKQVSKSLIHKLFIMDKETAEAFVELCKYRVEFEAYDVENNLVDRGIQFLYFSDRIGWDENYPLESNLLELETLGLIAQGTYYNSYDNTKRVIPIKKVCINYGKESLTLVGQYGFKFLEKDKIVIPQGTIYLSRDGQYLSNLVEKNDYVNSYLASIEKCYIEDGFSIE